MQQEAAVEHMSWLLYPKFIHYGLTLPSVRIFRLQKGLGGKLTLQDASVLLSYTWLAITLFGPYVPILNMLNAMLVKIYYMLLFVWDVLLLTKENQPKASSLESTGLHSISMIAMGLELGNLI
mmetsp:Transcript_12498/g.23064  ORF Transcript_12498/g.23064 Transcript_12498/m.23064 type:complete len:123 (-) Transcript_12498:41-409(-)